MAWANPTINSTVAYLNELLALDPQAVYKLVETRMACNAALADHSTCQVSCTPMGNTVGLLGVLNGLFGVDDRGYGPISAVFAHGRIVRFARSDELQEHS